MAPKNKVAAELYSTEVLVTSGPLNPTVRKAVVVVGVWFAEVVVVGKLPEPVEVAVRVPPELPVPVVKFSFLKFVVDTFAVVAVVWLEFPENPVVVEAERVVGFEPATAVVV